MASAETFLEREEIVDRDEASSLCEAVAKALKDANYKVCARARRDGVGVLGAPDQFRGGILQGILPGAFDRLGDAKAPVRDAGRELFPALMSSGAVAPAELVGEAPRRGGTRTGACARRRCASDERAFAELDREIEAGELSLPVKAIVAFGARARSRTAFAVREAAICAVVAADAAASRRPLGRAAAAAEAHRAPRADEGDPGEAAGGRAHARDQARRVARARRDSGSRRAAKKPTGRARPATSGSLSGLSPSPGFPACDARPATFERDVERDVRRRVFVEARGEPREPCGFLGVARARRVAARAPGDGGRGRAADREVALGGAASPADPDDPPPYGRATGVVPRIAEGAPPAPRTSTRTASCPTRLTASPSSSTPSTSGPTAYAR